MKNSFQAPLASLGLFIGILLALSSETLFGIWFGLELNMLSFISFIMMSRRHSITSEAMLKYFLIQAPASFIFLLNFLLPQQFLPATASSLAMSMKAGVAPFHFWLPQISESLSWNQLLILLTVQKLTPLFVLESCISKTSWFILLFLIISSAMVGALGGLNETSLRKLMSFSSISHLSWMITCMLLTSSFWFHYWSFYLFITLTLFITLQNSQIYHFTQMWSSRLPPSHQLMIIISLLSLMGLPPLLGFVPKLMVIYSVTTSFFLILMMVLIISSSFTLYYYLRLFMTLFHLEKSSKTPLNLISSQMLFPLLIHGSGLIFLPIMSQMLN